MGRTCYPLRRDPARTSVRTLHPADLHSHFGDIAIELAVKASEAGAGSPEHARFIADAVTRLLDAVSRTVTLEEPDARMDANGRAIAGSQLQLQLYVNNQPEVLAAAIIAARPQLADRAPHIEWRSPLSNERYAEYRDSAFLNALGLDEHAVALADFWPAGGPRWDALARIEFGAGGPGVLLVEGKAHPQEVLGSGCGASGRSLEQIASRLETLKDRLAVERAFDWLGPHYQSANRLAHLFFLRDRGIEAWLANVYFVDDWYGGTGRDAWQLALTQQKREFGLAEAPFSCDVFVPRLLETPKSLVAPHGITSLAWLSTNRTESMRVSAGPSRPRNSQSDPGGWRPL